LLQEDFFSSKSNGDYLNYILKTNGYLNEHSITAMSIHSPEGEVFWHTKETCVKPQT
jgi:hypothetical protein